MTLLRSWRRCWSELLGKGEMKFLGSLWYKELLNPYDSLNKTVLTGFDGAEVSIEYPLLDKQGIDINALSDFSNNYYLGIHLPWRDVSLASPIPEIRDGALKYIKRIISVLDRAEPQYFVLHVTTASLECRNSLRCIETASNTLTMLTKETATKIVVETTSGPCCGNLSAIGLLINEAEGVGVCLDVAQLVAEVFREENENWEKLVDLITEFLPLSVWRSVELTHIHGWEVRGKRIVPHRYPSQEQVEALRRFLRTVKERTGKLVTVFEVFYDSRGNPLHSWELGQLLREIARGL